MTYSGLAGPGVNTGSAAVLIVALLFPTKSIELKEAGGASRSAKMPARDSLHVSRYLPNGSPMDMRLYEYLCGRQAYEVVGTCSAL